MAEFLRLKTGLMHVSVVSNPSSGEDFIESLEGPAEEAEDMLLFYYSGHGVVVNNDLALTHSGSKTRRTGYTTVSFATIRQDIRYSGAAIKIIILDCCHSGRAFSGFMGLDANSALEEMAEIDGAYVLTATDTKTKFAVSAGGEGCTAFTGALLETLARGSSELGEYLPLRDAFPLLKRRLRAQNFPSPRATGSNTASLLALSRNGAHGPNVLGVEASMDLGAGSTAVSETSILDESRNSGHHPQDGLATLSAEDVHRVAFSPSGGLQFGYNEDEVDQFLDLVEQKFRDLDSNGLTPSDIRNVAFRKPDIGERGYNSDEVDQFLDFCELALSYRLNERRGEKP